MPAERRAMRYLIQMRWEPLPEPGTFIPHLKSANPPSTMVVVAKVWAKLKQFFNGQQHESYQQMENLMDVGGMVDAFTAAPYIELQGENSVEQESLRPERAQSSLTTNRSLSTARTSSGRKSTSDSSSSSGSSSASQLSVGAIKRMRLEFEQHGSEFTPSAWTTPSGANADAVIAEHVLTLVAESPMHSYIITDPSTMLKLFVSEADRQAVAGVIKSCTSDATWSLPRSEEHYLSLYDRRPEDLKEMLDMGCLGVMAEARARTTDEGAPLPGRSFCSLVHRLVDQLFRVYERNKFQVQSRKSESWFRENLWAGLHDIFNVLDALNYEPGEIHCQASARRKNRDRESTQTKQQVGRKADGLVSAVEPACELLIVEGANIDNGPQGTKAMTDTLKLAKMMKDMFDVILEKVSETIHDESILKDARHKLATFGLRFSAGSLALYSLRKLPQGRYYVLECEGLLTFPAVWKKDGSNTSTVLTVISTLLALQHRLLQMAKLIEGWTKVSFSLPKPVGAGDRAWPATLSTPIMRPRNAPSTSSSSTPPIPSAPAPPSPLRI
ncbi:hypothetical protein BGZ70_003479 [Mortierella alpina]|uniref:Uncharacterized protein n=1 Tax=Mortierella alpina TaxID=64518 RepID=A0A9P6ISA4_MORAP|nr:hypothetical protein BGZ70_003479 [Mortierella alpina]